MQLEAHEEKDGFKVWLTDSEIEEFCDVDDIDDRISSALMARCGLRSKEAKDVSKDDVVKLEDGTYRIRVWQGKGAKYREVPAPRWLADTITTTADARDLHGGESVIPYSKRTILRRVIARGEELAEERGEEGWKYVRPHDLRRSWGTLLVSKDDENQGVSPRTAMEWGGWDDWRTFRDRYLGKLTHDQEAKEMESVSWL
ncbi:tyrosine-type recombinase/integrase [Halobium palmae]|uniref:Tyrosine-type recombinase/integrase n=1 Tax=Halobium palmae TaxID=1776492 RepID=A0ABD5RW62_9EURY